MKPISKGGTSVPASRLLQNVATAHRIERIVPREHLTIARHFNAGFSCKLRQVPEGRLKFRHRFSRPCGTCPTTNLFPALKRRAIFRKSLWDCVLFPVVLILFFAAGATAETANDSVAAIIQGQNLAQQLLERPAESSTNTGILKIREATGKTSAVPIKFEIIVTTTNWQSIYEAFFTNTTENLTVTHLASPDGGADLLGFRHEYPTLPGLTTVFPDNRLAPFASSDFWTCDLGLEFFHWPAQKVLPKRTNLVRGRDYTLLESTNPNPSTNGYSRVLSWIDKETGGILQAEAYDFNGKLLKEFAPKSFKKVNGQWQLQEMVIRNVQTSSRTWLEFDLKK
jgi:Outer membrane lipoprotein-sorting protein